MFAFFVILLGYLARESVLEDMARGIVGSGVAAAVVLASGGGVKAGRRWCVAGTASPMVCEGEKDPLWWWGSLKDSWLSPHQILQCLILEIVETESP